MNFNREEVAIKKAIAKFFGIDLATPFTRVDGKTYINDLYAEMQSLGLMLCGGAITSIFSGQKINDLDFYMRDINRLEKVKEFFKKYFSYDVEPFQSINAITYRRKSESSRKIYGVQLITKFHGSPNDIHQWFDFTVVQGTYDFTTQKFYLGDRFLQDIARKRLVYCGKTYYPICAMYRTKKYMARGYTCPGSTIMHIALSIVRLDIKTYKELKEQLMGIDTSYLQGLLASPAYGDELPVDYGQFLADAFSRFDGFDAEDTKEDENESE